MSGSRPAEPARYLTLGQVVGAHGVRGGLRVNSFTDPPEALLKHREWHLLAANGQARDVRCTGGGEYRGQLRVELDGITDRDVALALAGCWVQVLRESLPKPAEREYFRADLIGLTVQNDESKVLIRTDRGVEGCGSSVVPYLAEMPNVERCLLGDKINLLGAGCGHWQKRSACRRADDGWNYRSNQCNAVRILT